MATNKNYIVSKLSNCRSNSDEQVFIGPEHLSSSSRKSCTPQYERKREMEKEKSDAALSRILDDPSFPFLSIGSTSASCAALRAWNTPAGSSGTRHR